MTKFIWKNGSEDSIEIFKTGHGLISDSLIGFISNDGVFFFSTENEQVPCSVTMLQEFSFTVNQAFEEMQRRKYAGIK